MLKLEAYESWLEDTNNWCNEHNITNNQTRFVLAMLTVLWVANKLGEPMSRLGALELVRADVEFDAVDDKVIFLPPKYSDMDLDDLLDFAVRTNLKM